MDKLSFTSRFRKDFRKSKHRGLSPKRLKEATELLTDNRQPPELWMDGPVAGEEGVRACRIAPGWLLYYRRENDRLWLIRLVHARERKPGNSPLAWLKNLLRSPGKTALTGVLIAAASFLLLYNLLDYTMTQRTYQQTYDQYQGYVSLQAAESDYVPDTHMFAARPYFLLSDPDATYAYREDIHPYDAHHLPSLTKAELDKLAALPYLSGTDVRYMTAGYSTLERMDMTSLDVAKTFYSWTHRVVLEGTYQHYTTEPPQLSNALDPTAMDISMFFTDMKVLTGNEEALRQSYIWTENRSLYIGAAVMEGEQDRFWQGGMRTNSDFVTNVFTHEDLASLVPGQRYIIIGSIDPTFITSIGFHTADEPMYPAQFPYVVMGDETLSGVWPYVYSLEGQPENYLETEEFAPLRELIEIMDADRHTLDVVYTDNMDSLRRYQEGKFLPVQGRLLTDEDTANRAPVCVISEGMAAANGLTVGDRITLQLGDKLFEQYSALGAVTVTQQRRSTNYTEQEFEIVGTFTETGLSKLANDQLFWTYGENAVFVPRSFLSVSEEELATHEFKPGEISFVIEDAGSIIPFKEEVLPQLLEMGYATWFFDGGWPAVEQQLAQAGDLSVLKLAAFAAAALLALWLTVYLFILRKKKEFAIMRALGCPTGDAIRALLAPLLCLGVVAIAMGSIAAVIYTARTAAQNLAEFADLGLTPDTSIPAGIVLGGVLGSLFLLLLLALAALHSLTRKAPLALLQDGANRGVQAATAEKATAAPSTTASSATAAAVLADTDATLTRSRSGLRHTLRYVFRHLRRTPAKALLSLLLALILCFAMGFFSVQKDTYADLYQSIEVMPRFVNGFPYERAEEVRKSGFVGEEVYYEYMDTNCECADGVDSNLVLTNDFSRVCTSSVEWKDGYGPDMFQTQTYSCVISRDLAEKLDLKLGSKVEVTHRYALSLLMADNPGVSIDELMEEYHANATKVYIAGISDESVARVYAPMDSWRSYRNVGKTLYLDMAEYSLNDYHHAVSFRSYGEQQLAGLTNAALSLETEEADRIYQTYRLIEMLYPIAFAVAILLGGVLPGIIILQSAKEASLLRVLGTTKRRTRAMLTLEQIFLCFGGLALAIAALFAANGQQLQTVAGLLALYLTAHFVFCILASFSAAVSVTRRRVLELLQVKE